MIRLVVLVLVLLEVSAEEDLTTEKTMQHAQVYREKDYYHDGIHVDEKEIHMHKRRNHVARLVSDVFHHDHMEPITVYNRHLNTGSQEYTRGHSNLAVPKKLHVHTKTKTENYDAMLHYLREKQLAEHHHEIYHEKRHDHDHHYDQHHDHHYDQHHDHHYDQHHDYRYGRHHDNHRLNYGASISGYKRYAKDFTQEAKDLKPVEIKTEHEESNK